MDAVYFEYDESFANLKLQDCVLRYKKFQTDFLLRVILYKLKGTLNYYMYRKTDYPDKSELLELFEDKLIECLESYEPGGNALFSTYYSKCLNNALINFAKIKLNRNKVLSLDYEFSSEFLDSGSASGSLASCIVDDDLTLVNVESKILLEHLKDKLDDNEYIVCKVILNENHNLTHTEIAKEIGLTVPAIRGIFDRLKKRFEENGICNNYL